MSQCLLCRGQYPIKKIKGVNVIKYPFEHSFNNDMSKLFWGNHLENVWTIEPEELGHIDDFFTEAQRYLHERKDNKFEDTRIYKILIELMSYHIEIVLWYPDSTSKLPIFNNKNDFIKCVSDGITTEMCEVYAWYK